MLYMPVDARNNESNVTLTNIWLLCETETQEEWRNNEMILKRSKLGKCIKFDTCT